MLRRRLAALLDLLAAACLLASVTILVFGGDVFRIGSVRVSLRSPDRALLWYALVVLVRLIAFGHRSLIERLRTLRQSVVTLEPDPQLQARRPGSRRRLLLATLGLGGAVAVLLREQLLHPFTVPDLGDPLFSMWRIGWVVHRLFTDPSRIFDGNIFYPEKLTLTLSDPLIVPSVAAAPFVAAGVHPVLTYQLLLFCAFWLSGVATYMLVERLTASSRAGFIAGLLFAVAAFRLDHYSHLELQMTLWMPLGLLALHLFVTTGRWRYAMGLSLAGVAQLYSSMYYGVFFLIYVAIAGALLLLVYRPPLVRLLAPVAVAGLLAAVLAAPLARAFVAAEPMKGERPVAEIQFYSAIPTDYLHAHQYSALWRLAMPTQRAERALFPGAAPLALAAVALVPPFSAIRLVYAAALVTSFDASLGFNGFLYPYYYRWLPPVRGLRAPARFSALATLSLAILAGFGATRILRRISSRTGRTVATVAVTFVILIDAWPLLTLRPVWRQPPAIYAHLPPDAVLAELPIVATSDGTNEVFNIPYMYFSLWHKAAMVNGYSGFIPPSYKRVGQELRTFPQDDTMPALRRRGVTHVTVNCGLDYPGCSALARQLLVTPGLRLVDEGWWEGKSSQLFELTR
jgi:hypothetical protein